MIDEDAPRTAIAKIVLRVMDRSSFYEMMSGGGTLDYELYLNTKNLLACQKDFDAFCNPDELQFQIVHQIEELWMKLIAYTLIDIDEYLQQENTPRVVTLFRLLASTISDRSLVHRSLSIRMDRTPRSRHPSLRRV